MNWVLVFIYIFCFLIFSLGFIVEVWGEVRWVVFFFYWGGIFFDFYCLVTKEVLIVVFRVEFGYFCLGSRFVGLLFFLEFRRWKLGRFGWFGGIGDSGVVSLFVYYVVWLGCRKFFRIRGRKEGSYFWVIWLYVFFIFKDCVLWFGYIIGLVEG